MVISMGEYGLPVMILLPLVAGGIGYWIGTKNKKLRDRFTAIVTVLELMILLVSCSDVFTGAVYELEVAELCGFENVYYFSNVFKKYKGVSPKNYK